MAYCVSSSVADMPSILLGPSTREGSVNLLSFLQFNTETDATTVFSGTGVYIGPGSVSASELPAEETNTRSSTNNASVNPNAGPTTPRVILIPIAPRVSTYQAWRADYRRRFIKASFGTNVGVCIGWQSGSLAHSQNAFWIEEYGQQLHRTGMRRSRKGIWCFNDVNCCLHKKTGGGAYELTSRPHPINDGITWVDERLWELGYSQSDVSTIVLHPRYAPTIVLNTADGNNFGNDATPTLEMTASDVDGSDVSYEVQIGTDSSFSSGDLIDSYSESNQSTSFAISSEATHTQGTGQAFTAPENFKIGSAKLWLKVYLGSPTGNAVVNIYAATGTIGTNAKPTGSILASSDNFDVSTLTGSYQLITFNFTGANQINLTGGSNYCVFLEYTDGNSTNAVEIGFDNSAPTHSGNLCWKISGAFNGNSNDCCFYVLETNTLLLDKLSSSDAGFLNTVSGGDLDPFTQAQKVSFTVQAGDALTAGTYYWRARARDPLDSNTWSDWATARSFITTGGGPNLTTLTGSLSFVGTDIERISKSVSATLSFIGATLKRTAKSALTAALSFVGTFTRVRLILKGLTATLEFGKGFPMTGLVSYWKLDEAAGTTKADSQGSNALSDPTNCTSLSGLINNAPYFTSGQNWLSHADNSDLRVSGDFFWSIWVRVDNVANLKYFQDKYDGSTSQYAFWHDPSTGFGFGSGSLRADVGAPATQYSWYHLVGWFDSSDNKVRLRVNDATTYISASSAALISANTADLTVGALLTSINALNWEGFVDEVGFWKRIPTAADITALYNGGAGLAYGSLTVPGGVLVRKTLKALSAALAFVGALIRKIFDLHASTLSFIGTLLRRIPAKLTATLSFIGALFRRAPAKLTASLSFAGAIIKRINDTAASTLSFVGTFLKRVKPILASILSFIGSLVSQFISGGQQFAQNVFGTLSFTGTFTKKTGKLLAAALSFIGAIQRRTARTITATLSFIVGVFLHGARASLAAALNFSGALNRRISRLFNAALLFIGNLFRSQVRTLTAALGFAGSLSKKTLKAFTAVLNFIGTSIERVGRLLAATLSFTGVMFKRTARSVAATLSFIGSLVSLKSFTQLMTATLSFVGAISKRTSRLIPAAISFIGTLINRSVRFFAATLSFIGNIFRRTSTTDTATLSFIGTLTKRGTRIFTATLGFLGTFSKRAGKFLTGVISFVGALPKSIRPKLVSILSFVGALNAAAAGHFFQTLTSTLDFSAALSKRVGHLMASVLSFIGALGKRVPRTLTAALSFIGSLAVIKLLTRAFTATLNFTGAFLKRTGKAFTATLSFIGTQIKQIRSKLVSALSFIGVITRGISRRFTATLSFIGSLLSVKLLVKLLTATLGFVGALKARANKLFFGVLSFVGQLNKRIPGPIYSTLNFVSNLPKKTRKLTQSVLSFIATFAAIGGKVMLFTANLDLSGTLFRAMTRIFSNTLVFIGTITKRTARTFTAIVSFIGTLVGNIPTDFARTFSGVLSFSGSMFQRAGKYIKIFLGAVTEVIKVSLLRDLLGINISTAPAAVEVKITVPEDTTEINISAAGNPPEIKIQTPGNLN